MMFKLIISFFILTQYAFANYSMRRCTLLPVTDSVGGAIGIKVFEKLEEKIKTAGFCEYQANSSMIGVFTKYRDSLAQHLGNSEVMAAVGEKLKTGSIFRVNLKSEIQGIEINFDIVSGDGQDLLFSEKILLNKDDVNLVVETIHNWLLVYDKIIPYDGRIAGILGEQITLDIGKTFYVKLGQKFIIKRMRSKRKHPLIKKIVDWESENIAEGEVIQVSENQALGKISKYISVSKPMLHDWIRLGEVPEKAPLASEPKDDWEHGRLGYISPALLFSNSGVTTSTDTGSFAMNGNLIGFDLRMEGWITRNYFALIDLYRMAGSLKKSSGNPSVEKIEVTTNMVKFVGGYKYLPAGFFYGPQLDLYLGYFRFSSEMNNVPADGFANWGVRGFILGVAPTIPIDRKIKITARAELSPLPSFVDDDGVYGTAKNLTVMMFEIGGQYLFAPRMNLDLALAAQSFRSKLKSSVRDLAHRDTFLRLGVSYQF